MQNNKFTMERNKIEQFYKIVDGLCAKNKIIDSSTIKDIKSRLSTFVDNFVHNRMQIKDIYREFYSILKEFHKNGD